LTEVLAPGDCADVDIELSFYTDAEEDIRDDAGRFSRDDYSGSVEVYASGDFETESGEGSLTLNVSLWIEYRDGSDDSGAGAAQLGGMVMGPEVSGDEIADIVADYAEGYAELVSGSKGVVAMGIESAFICNR